MAEVPSCPLPPLSWKAIEERCEPVVHPMEAVESTRLGGPLAMRTHRLRARVRRRSSKSGHEGVDVHVGQFPGLFGSVVRAVDRSVFGGRRSRR